MLSVRQYEEHQKPALVFPSHLVFQGWRFSTERDRHARTDSDHSLISVLRWKTVRDARNAKPKVGCLCVSDGIVQLTSTVHAVTFWYVYWP